MDVSRSELEEAHAAAAKARANSYSPYSKFKVGAALILEDGEIVAGCNVENASFGATVCAERNAIFSAVTQFGKIRPRALVLVTEPKATPCGMCLQVIAEFCAADMPVYLGTPAGPGSPLPLEEMLPHPFDAAALE